MRIYFLYNVYTLSLFQQKIEMLFSLHSRIQRHTEMNRQEQIRKEQSQREHRFFCNLAATLAVGNVTPEQACSMIEKLRDQNIFAQDILKPETKAEEQQKGFNEIAGMFADWKITTEEACELFVEWIEELKTKALNGE
jgi:hypothetical protein